jgi:alanine racemase
VYSIETIRTVIKGSFLHFYNNSAISYITYDSRKVQHAPESLFFAIITNQNDGHKYLADAYRKGVRNFIVSESKEYKVLKDSNIIIVNEVVRALQELAHYHRLHFTYPVVAITGSNGKTIVKEWLNILLQPDYKIIRSPKSYNSQIGVPLSIWQMSSSFDLAIIEAGISLPGEMVKLEEIILPDIGIITNLGEAHSANFKSEDDKLKEKLKLFIHCKVVIGPYSLLSEIEPSRKFTWGYEKDANLQILNIKKHKTRTIIEGVHKGGQKEIHISFIDDASIENAITCWCFLLNQGFDDVKINNRFPELHAIDMRLQLMHGINGCMVINDSYSADLTSLRIALDFQAQQSSGLKRTVILSDFIQTGYTEDELSRFIIELLNDYKIEKVVFIGDKHEKPSIYKSIQSSFVSVHTYLSTDDFIKDFKSSSFLNEIILIKGARIYEMERIAVLFQIKLHQTSLDVNLNAIIHNLKEYRRLLSKTTKIMVMVKAFAYGSGGSEIAGVLQFHNVDYLAVAYSDEGIELVKSGISLPIMIMNVEPNSFASIVQYGLQPVIYSNELLVQFENYLLQEGLSNYPVHIEIETGMNRLGFALEELGGLGEHIHSSQTLTIQSVFTHLVASEDPQEEQFTRLQAKRFDEALANLKSYINYPFLSHICNSAAIVRYPDLQMDMVRLGIGLYGIETDDKNVLKLQNAATLRATIAQVKRVKKGESVSYNRMGVVSRDSIIATVRIGYADGYNRRFGNGIGKMLVKGKIAPVIGNVCMDMTMVDVTDIPNVKEDEEVLIFGQGLPVTKVASWINTIPYEIMTGISQRVKRVYFLD